jgi:hypothetical protein
MDPLTEKDALVCASLVEAVIGEHARRPVVRSSCGGEVAMANAGLIVLGGVEAFEWRAERRPTARTSWNVDASVPASKDGVVNLRLIFFPSADLTVAARSAAFFAGDVPGLPEAPSDFAGGDAEVAAGMASMESPFE